MENTLLRVFRHLGPQERRQIAALAHCDYFNRRPEVARLCEHLTQYIDGKKREPLRPEALFAAALPGQPYDNRQLRHLQSYLLDLVRQYLTQEALRDSPQEQHPLLLRALRRRGIDDFFQKTRSASLGIAERNGLRDARYHFQQYQLHQESLEQATRHERSARLNFQPLPDELTIFYVSEMLRHACVASMHEAVAGQAYRLRLLEAILEVVEQEALLGIPAIAVYFHAYQMLRHPDDSAPLDAFCQSLNEHVERFSVDEQRGLYLLAINGCIRRMNAGKREYVSVALGFYREALERGVLMENGVLTSFNYKNIIRLAVASKEHTWAEQFLEAHRPTLHPRERDNIYRYNLAFLRFQQQDYARAMPLLQQVELEDPLNNLDARRMLLRSYYEMGEWQALDSLLQSFGAYLRRQKNLGYHRQTNERLLYFTKKLMEIPRNDRAARALLRDELEQTPDVAERAWLLQHLQQ